MPQATFSTKVSQPEQGSNGKWAAAFENWVQRGSDRFMSSRCTSSPVFDTAADAEEGSKRALTVLEATGKFPNMCEVF